MVLGGRGCSNKLAQNGLKNRHLFSHSSEAHKSKIQMQQGQAPQEGSQGEPFPASSRRCQVFRGLWSHHFKFCLCVHMTSSPLCPFLSPIKKLAFGFRFLPANPDDLISKPSN